MKGLPKYFATKQDYLNCLDDPELADATKEKLTALADSRFIWQTTGNVEGVDDGITDDTHRIVQSKDEEENEVFLQQELVEDENAEVFRLGFTLDEIDELTE